MTTINSQWFANRVRLTYLRQVYEGEGRPRGQLEMAFARAAVRYFAAVQGISMERPGWGTALMKWLSNELTEEDLLREAYDMLTRKNLSGWHDGHDHVVKQAIQVAIVAATLEKSNDPEP